LPDGPIIPARDGVCVAIRLSPRARSEGLLSVSLATEGGRVVKASVTVPAQNGRANEALLLAKTWRLPRRDLSIVAGAASRSKTVRVAGGPHQLIAKLSGEIASLPSG
jgi:uncharacterized protein